MDFFLQGRSQVSGWGIEAATGVFGYASAVEVDVVEILEGGREAGGEAVGEGAGEGEEGVGCC